jgi:lipopolysaccharide/colanic/teichoic acid biosynthesis glycosyltransferase
MASSDWNPLRIHSTELVISVAARSMSSFLLVFLLARSGIGLGPYFAALLSTPISLLIGGYFLSYFTGAYRANDRPDANYDFAHVRRSTFKTTPQQIAEWRKPYDALKRMFDIVVSFALLILLFPVFAIVAFAIKLDSAGPAIFTQKRAGKNGAEFRIYKFRTMRNDTERYDLSPTRSSDQRITRLGRFLRKSSLDELPQLVNVLLGDMSLVGPRPEMPFIVDTYTQYHRQRLAISPGITGLWQLSSARTAPIHENLHYDFYYIHHRTFFMDLAILIHTLFFSFRGI